MPGRRFSRGIFNSRLSSAEACLFALYYVLALTASDLILYGQILGRTGT